MKILALDCAGSGCSVCLWQDGAVLSLAEETMARGQDARLMPMIQESMAAAHLSFPVLDLIAATRGPGSFTGLRIGLASARGIGLAAGKPVVGIDRFSVFRAQHAAVERDLVVALDSRRAELYARFYPAGGAAQEPLLLTPDEIKARWPDALVAGDASSVLESCIQPSSLLPPSQSEAVTCALLASRIADVTAPDVLPRPFYLRPPDVTFAKPLCGAC